MKRADDSGARARRRSTRRGVMLTAVTGLVVTALVWPTATPWADHLLLSVYPKEYAVRARPPCLRSVGRSSDPLASTPRSYASGSIELVRPEPGTDDAAKVDASYEDAIKMFRTSASGRFFADAYGYAVFPTVGEGGAVIGASYGKGSRASPPGRERKGVSGRKR